MLNSRVDPKPWFETAAAQRGFVLGHKISQNIPGNAQFRTITQQELIIWGFFQPLQCREALWGYFKLLGVSDAGNTQSRFWGSPWKEMPFPRGGGNVHPQNNILIQKNNWKEIFLTPGVGEDKKESGLM